MTTRPEQGSAVIMAMLVVAATATLVSGALWQQSALMRETENELAYAQAKWLLRGAIDWAGVILLEDGRTSSVDHRGEPWAVPLADTRLNEGDARPAAYLAGAIDDEQSKLNLRNLAAGDQVNPGQLAALGRLLGMLGIDETFADAIAARLIAAQRGGNRQPDPARAFLEELIDVGMGPDAMERLRPFLTLLPETTPLNVNTASAEVLAATVPDLTLLDAKRIVAARSRAYFRDLADALQRLREAGAPATGEGLSVATRYFSIDGTVTYARARLEGRALVKREANRLEVIWVRELG
ncbi:MAG TPA: type II secretion system minor pseudopilin GspK [Burkholderiales bacterium]|nr:type II secretion system minor pseudopilin GspK [Burkholderiales bacterium]